MPTDVDLVLMFFHRLATKSAHEKVKQWTQKCWLEMGVFTMTFYGFIRADGKFSVDM
jgi:hypothetical protein